MPGQNYDVLIVGGGLVGASLACALRGSGLGIALIEANPLNTASQPSFDDRTVALSYGSRQILERIGLWAQLEARVEAIKTIHISDRGQFGVTRLRHDEEGVEALGYVAENRVLGEVLYAELENSDDIELFCPAEVSHLEAGNDRVEVQVQQGEQVVSLRSRLLVAADGVSSKVRQRLQIAASRQDYAQSAIITNVRPGQPHNNVAYERFTDTGPLAFLPMTRSAGKQPCYVVWYVPTAQAEALMQLADGDFLAALQQRFGYRLGRLQQLGKRQVYPLALVETTQLVRGRIVVVGNAAHSVHPVAGQGFNLALRDIALLAELLTAATDTGDPALLESYVSARQQDAQRVYRFTDTLVKLFSNHFSPLAHARAAGLFTVDLLPPLKHALARQSMGLGGNLSRLGRGLARHREKA
jgi:2-octaprenyl-6-methoxyphenol hydroxylase